MKQKILLVDDDVLLTNTLKKAIANTGRYEVRAENDPAKALGAAIEFKPDLVVLDVMMPRLDGGDVATKLKDDPRTHATPVLFLTSVVTEEQVKAGEGLVGGHPFVAKSSNVPELLKRIEQVLPPPPAPHGR